MVQDKIQMCQHVPAAVTQPCHAAAGPFFKGFVKGSVLQMHQAATAGAIRRLLKHPGVVQRELILFRTAPGIEAAPQSGAELV